MDKNRIPLTDMVLGSDKIPKDLHPFLRPPKPEEIMKYTQYSEALRDACKDENMNAMPVINQRQNVAFGLNFPNL